MDNTWKNNLLSNINTIKRIVSWKSIIFCPTNWVTINSIKWLIESTLDITIPWNSSILRLKEYAIEAHKILSKQTNVTE